MCDKSDRPITYVFSGDLHLSKCCLKEGEVRRESFSTKLLSRLSHKVCRLLSSLILLRKLTNMAAVTSCEKVLMESAYDMRNQLQSCIVSNFSCSLVIKKTSKI